MEEQLTYGERLRRKGVAFHGVKTPSKTLVHHTDTAIVTETVKDESNDVNVALRDCVRPHWDLSKQERSTLKERAS